MANLKVYVCGSTTVTSLTNHPGRQSETTLHLVTQSRNIVSRTYVRQAFPWHVFPTSEYLSPWYCGRINASNPKGHLYIIHGYNTTTSLFRKAVRKMIFLQNLNFLHYTAAYCRRQKQSKNDSHTFFLVFECLSGTCFQPWSIFLHGIGGRTGVSNANLVFITITPLGDDPENQKSVHSICQNYFSFRSTLIAPTTLQHVA